MKKAIITISIALLALNLYAQSSLFETVFTDPIDTYINDVAPYGSGWLSVGHYDDCMVPYMARLDSAGNVVWQHQKPFYFGFAWYNTIAETHNGYYVVGHNLIGDDYPSDFANGFIDFLDLNGNVGNLVTDTVYKGGFHQIAYNDSLVLVTANKNEYGKKPFVVCYDIAGNWLWEREFVGRDLVNIHFMDTLIWAVTDSFTYQMNLQGQMFPDSLRIASIHSYLSSDTTIALVTEDNSAQWFDTDLDFVFLTRFGVSFFELIDIFGGPTDKKYALLNDTIQNQLIIAGENDSPSRWVRLPYYCTNASALAVKDSIITVGGNLKSDKLYFGVMRSADLQSNSYVRQTEMELVSSSLSIDSINIIDTFDQVLVYRGQIDLVVKNKGLDTLKSFYLHTDVSTFNCAKGYNDSLYQNLMILPGNTMHLQLDLPRVSYFYLVNNDTILIDLEVYALAPNQKLSDTCSAPFTITPYVYVGVNDIELSNRTKVYPNPIDSEVSFSDLPYNSTISVFTLQGKTVAHSIAVDTNVSINLSHLPSGMYLYNIANNEGQVIKTGKLVKQ